MLKHYFTLAYRNLFRNKFHSTINIVGLAIGISACIILFLIVRHEIGFNKGFAAYHRIYRIHASFSGVFTGLNRGVSTAAGPYVKENFKGLEATTLFHTLSGPVKIAGQIPKDFGEQKKLALTAPDYFQVFDSYQWLVGSPEQSLADPNRVVLTKEKAEYYFGQLPVEQYLNKELIYRDSLFLTVSGIVAALPFNSDLEITDFLSFTTIQATWLKKSYGREDWGSTNSSCQLFVRALPGTAPSDLQIQLPQLATKYKAASTWDAENNFGLQPLADLHYNANLGIFDFSREPAHLPTLTTLSGIAVLLLIIGCINFINLETAQAVHRAKEVGVRKVMGSDRGRLIFQFIAESSILACISLLLALPLTEVGLLYFAEFIPPGVSLNLIGVLPFLIAMLVIIGVLGGSYPAFILSSYSPVMALKNSAFASSSQSRSAFLRQALIVTQFTFAQVLILGTLVVGWQIRYMINKDLGFSKDEVIYLDTPWWDKSEKVALLKTELEAISQVKELTLSDSPPSANGWSSTELTYNSSTGESKINAFRKPGDTNYLAFYNIRLLAGRNVLSSDTIKEVLVNETLINQLGFDSPEKALGEVVDLGNVKVPIVGVVKDFHTKSLRDAIDPVFMGCENKYFNCFNIRLNSANKSGTEVAAALTKVEQAWKKVYPDAPFVYTFLDETIRNFYNTEQRIAKLINTATLLAILISCLGLFGLASYSTTQRLKEIGIRKVLGASVKQLTLLLTREFLLYVLIAFVIAMPIAIYGATSWLQGFAYHIELTAWMFATTALAALLIAFGTISLKTIRAAQRNPVDSLRSE
jgi:putative ABC transport system permease protein